MERGRPLARAAARNLAHNRRRTRPCPGRESSAARLGAPVTVRVGSLLQVRAAPGLEARLRRVPGVAGIGPAAVASPTR